MNKFIDFVLDAIFPPNIKCLVCAEDLNKDTKYCICDECMEKLPFVTGTVCAKCGVPIRDMGKYCINCKSNSHIFSKNECVFEYIPPISTLVKNLKFNGKKYIGYTLSNFVASKVIESGRKYDMVLPVPMHADRLKERGFNHAELLCKTLKDLGMDVRTDVLIKSVNTKSQASLKRSERLANLKDSFKVADKSAVENKTILLVDDVITTGSTLDECAEVLLKAGAFKVYSVTLTHA